MLKEIYVLRDGIIVFHYSSEDNVDESSLVLASGFLSALDTFSKETRAASIDFFASETEFFIFDDFNDETNQLVAIFSNSMEHSVGREIVKEVKRLVLHSTLIDLSPGMSLGDVQRISLESKIDKLAQSITSVNFQIEASGDLFDELEDISLLILHDYNRMTVHFAESRPVNLYHEDQLVALRSVHRYFKRMIKALNLGTNFELITIDYEDYSLVLSKRGMVITLCYSQNPSSISQIHQVPLRILSLPDYESYKMDFLDIQKTSTLIVNQENKITVQSGEATTRNAENAIVKGFSALYRLLETLDIEQFQNISIYISDPKFALIRVMNLFTSREKKLEIFRN